MTDEALRTRNQIANMVYACLKGWTPPKHKRADRMTANDIRELYMDLLWRRYHAMEGGATEREVSDIEADIARMEQTADHFGVDTGAIELAFRAQIGAAEDDQPTVARSLFDGIFDNWPSELTRNK